MGNEGRSLQAPSGTLWRHTVVAMGSEGARMWCCVGVPLCCVMQATSSKSRQELEMLSAWVAIPHGF